MAVAIVVAVRGGGEFYTINKTYIVVELYFKKNNFASCIDHLYVLCYVDMSHLATNSRSHKLDVITFAIM